MSRSALGTIFRRRKGDGRAFSITEARKLPASTFRPGYYIRLRVGGQDVWRKAGQTLRETREYLVRIEHELFEQRAFGKRAVRAKRFGTFVNDDYLPLARKTLSDSTILSVESRVRHDLEPHFKNCELHEIDSEDVERFLLKKADDGVTGATRNRILSTLSQIMEKAVDRGHARENPCRRVKRMPEPERPVPWVPYKKQQLLVEHAGKLEDLVSVAMATGLRQSELLRLEWRDVQLDRRIIVVRHSKNYRSREVPIRSDTLSILRRRRDDRVLPLTGPDRVFAELAPRWNGYMARMFRSAAAAAGLADFRFHDLRHVAAVNMVRAGVPMPDAKRILGHQSLRMLSRYASHAPTDSAERSLSMIDAKL